MLYIWRLLSVTAICKNGKRAEKSAWYWRVGCCSAPGRPPKLGKRILWTPSLVGNNGCGVKSSFGQIQTEYLQSTVRVQSQPKKREVRFFHDLGVKTSSTHVKNSV